MPCFKFTFYFLKNVFIYWSKKKFKIRSRLHTVCVWINHFNMLFEISRISVALIQYPRYAKFMAFICVLLFMDSLSRWRQRHRGGQWDRFAEEEGEGWDGEEDIIGR